MLAFICYSVALAATIVLNVPFFEPRPTLKHEYWFEYAARIVWIIQAIAWYPFYKFTVWYETTPIYTVYRESSPLNPNLHVSWFEPRPTSKDLELPVAVYPLKPMLFVWGVYLCIIPPIIFMVFVCSVYIVFVILPVLCFWLWFVMILYIKRVVETMATKIVIDDRVRWQAARTEYARRLRDQIREVFDTV